MDNNERVTAVIVDTCAFQNANSDFVGMSSMRLPSFFTAIYEKDILLLTHPILEWEVEKHIEDSGLYKDYQKLLLQINKCKDILKYNNCYDEKLFFDISEYDIKQDTFNAFKQYYKNAVKLDYPDPEIVFKQYFMNEPPFAKTGNKKHEFPDAFVIESLKQYMQEHPNEVVLVVSKDKDWESALEAFDQVLVCESIDQALKKVLSIESILSEEMLEEVFRGVYEEMLSDAQSSAECECYDLNDYEFYDDLEIESVEVESIDDGFIPLKISRDMILIRTVVNLKVSGQGEIFDADRSGWDSEDGDYIFREYSDIQFTDAYAEVECEIGIRFDFDDPKESAMVDSFKFCNRGNIELQCSEVSATPISEDEMALRCLREDKGYTRRL